MLNNCIEIIDNFKERTIQTAIWLLQGLITGIVCGLTICSYKIFAGKWMILCILLAVISISLLFIFIRQMFIAWKLFKEEAEEFERDWENFEKIMQSKE